MTLSRIITTTVTGLLTSVLILSGITTSAISQDDLNKKQLKEFNIGIGRYTNDANAEIINSKNLLVKSKAKFKECEIKLDKANIESTQFFKDNTNGQRTTIDALRKKLNSQPDKITELNRLENAIETAITICDQGMEIQDRFDKSVCVVSFNMAMIENLIFDLRDITAKNNAQKEKVKKLDPITITLYNQYVNRKNNFENLKRKYPKYLRSIAPYANNYCSRSSMYLSQIIERNNNKNKITSRVSNTRSNSSTITRNLKTNNKNNRTIS